MEPFDLAEIVDLLPTGAVARLVDEAVLNIASSHWQVAVEWPCEPEHALAQAVKEQSNYEHRLEQRAQSKAHKEKVKAISTDHMAKKEAAIRKVHAAYKAKKEKK